MKTFSEIWARMILKNSRLLESDAKMEIKVSQFRKALSQAFDAGAASTQGDKAQTPQWMKDLFK